MWAPEAERLWERIRTDEDLSRKQSRSVTTAADRAATPTPAEEPSSSPSEASDGSTEQSPASEARAGRRHRENGLCA